MQKVIEISQYQLERGKPMPSKLHSRVQSNLNFELLFRYREQYDFLSELSLELSDWDSVPDIAVYPRMEYDYSKDEVRVTVAPLCAIEILSPSQSLQELLDKAQQYFSYGVKSCWLVIPGLKNIYVFKASGEYQMFRDTETLIDGDLEISLELSKVFI